MVIVREGIAELDVRLHKVVDRIRPLSGAVHENSAVTQASFRWVAFGAVLAGSVVVMVATTFVELGRLISLAGYVAHCVSP